MELLQTASEHAFPLPEVSRAAVAAEVLKVLICPVVSALVRLEEVVDDDDDSIRYLPPSSDKAAGTEEDLSADLAISQVSCRE
jgi:hypothetical protein